MSDEPLRLMQRAARKAAFRMIDSLAQPAKLQGVRKADRSWVLGVDMESHHLILEELCASIPCISEESERTHHLLLSESEYFLIDPLDGTSACKRFGGDTEGQVGFGPLLGYVRDGKIESAVFAHIPKRLLFSAKRGEGLFISTLADPAATWKLPRRAINVQLDECVLLFHLGSLAEAKLVFLLKDAGYIDNVYRFGGFANDCSRLAMGFEEIQLQLSVNAWDLPATLLAAEAGFEVMVDPLGAKAPLSEWRVQASNPVLVCPPNLTSELINAVCALRPQWSD